jgi:hypothetical protein
MRLYVDCYGIVAARLIIHMWMGWRIRPSTCGIPLSFANSLQYASQIDS